MDITIDKIPSMNSVSRAIQSIPRYLTDQKLAKEYAKILAYLAAAGKGNLPNGYFTSAATQASSGFVPKDMWLRMNAQTAKDEYQQEFTKRNLADKYTFFVLI